MSYKIEPREGIEVYLNKAGGICIRQESNYTDDPVIFVHHEDVPRLIEHLEAVRQEALDFVPEPETETQ